jgi:hypothetical protein
MTIYLYAIEELSKFVDHIKIGDICLVYHKDIINFIVVKECFHKELMNELIQVTYRATMPQDAFEAECKGIIFSFNGNEKRYGNKAVLAKISSIFSNNICHLFISDLIDILDYREDRINIDYYRSITSAKTISWQIHIQEQLCKIRSNDSQYVFDDGVPQDFPKDKEDDNRTKGKEQNEVIFAPESYLFFHYLDERGKKYWIDNYTKVKRLRDLYLGLRKKYRQSFSNALKSFDTDNQGTSIYTTINQK